MNKKIIKIGGLVGLLAIVGVVAIFLIQPKVVAKNSQQKTYPQKDSDIAPVLPVPKNTAISQPAGSSFAAAQIVFVPRVIDGDTIVVELVDAKTGKPGKQETVRYIGMDTPETVSPVKPVECYGHEASARNKALVDGKYVAIVPGTGDKDKYGRLLRFVYLLNSASSDTPTLGTNVDIELVKEGYARVLTIPPNTELAADFNAAASAAQSAKLGFWGACATYPFQ